MMLPFLELPDPLPIRKSLRAKRMSLKVHEDGRWEVVVPFNRVPSRNSIEQFVLIHLDWIRVQVGKCKNRVQKNTLSHQGVSRTQVEMQTRLIIREQIDELKRIYAFDVGRVRLGKFSSQWGSCSREKNLSFHYKLSLLPPELCRYVVAHELSHTIHFNHGKAFWGLLEELCPGARGVRKQLRHYSL